MNRINKVLIGIGFLAVLALLLNRFVIQKEPEYTAAATVELLRDDPTSLEDQDKIDIKDLQHSIHFTNNCSDLLAVRIAEEKQVFQPDESGEIKVPATQDSAIVTILRRTETETKVVFETKLFMSEGRAITMTASDDTDGSFRLVTERGR